MDEKLFKHGKFSWNELITTDVEGARAFYGKLFGWQYDGFPM
jgi:predicted enzyme related to lactoylglutathione lyase